MTPNSESPMSSRRHFLKGATGLAALAGASVPARAQDDAAAAPDAEWYTIKNGRINQSVIPWCFNPMPVPELAKGAAKMGLKSVELTGPENWPMLKELGLTCAIAGSHGFAKGFAHREEWDECLAKLRASIDASAAFGCPNVITFSGFRRELTDEDALKNMVEGLKKIVPYAEEKKVTLALEMLNSRVDENMKGHPDYWCDKIEHAVDVCKAIGSERMKILFDIYHVQIMQGDVITRIKQYHQYIAHYHTAGNPGRNELDDTQEIHYPGIMKAILETGYTGFVGQEFIPTRDKLQSLSEGVRMCDV
jgi:hydroxypyruvate isomerase